MSEFKSEKEEGFSLIDDKTKINELNSKKEYSNEKDDNNKSSLSNFYNQIGRNGGIIFHVEPYPVKDMNIDLKKESHEELLAIESINAYEWSEIQVIKIDASVKGYVMINERINIPLHILNGKSSEYFFDRNEAIKEYKRLNEIELNLCKKIQFIASKAENYLNKIISKDLH